jgi:hypothetical protein
MKVRRKSASHSHEKLLPSRMTPNLSLFALQVWAEVRDDANLDVDWVLIGYDGQSKTDMTVLEKGNGGLSAISTKLPEGIPVFGGVRLKKGRFVSFLYIDDNVVGVKRGRTLMFKNGVYNAMLGCDGSIEMTPGLTEETMGQIR